MPISLSIDRFEDGPEGGKLAVLITDDGDQIVFPRGLLPKGSRAGDLLTLTIERDEAGTRSMKSKTRAVQDDLKKRDPGGDLKL